MRINYLLIALILGITYSCTSLNFYSDDEHIIIAEIGDKKLYSKDVYELLESEEGVIDSLQFIQNYATNWIKQELKITESEKLFSKYQDDIDILVERYRKSLLTYKLENYYSNMIDTTIENSEVIEHYNKYKNQYRLPSPIVKARVMVVPNSYKKQSSISKLFYSTSDKDYQDLLSTVEKDNLIFHSFEDDWRYFSEVVKLMPFPQVKYDNYLKSKSREKIADSDNTYYLLIKEYKNSGDYMPMKYVEDNIKTAIINVRRKSMFKRMEDSLYNANMNTNKIMVLDVDSSVIKKFRNLKH